MADDITPDVEPIVEHRVPDDLQPIALSQAEEVGTLPDTDRREPEAPIGETVAEATIRLLTQAGGGTSLLKEHNGDWRILYMKDGRQLQLTGKSIPEAFTVFGLHVPHDSFGAIHADQVGPQHLEWSGVPSA